MKKKFEEFANFLQTAPINTFVAVTETGWTLILILKITFLGSHTSFGKCRSDKKGASKGGGVCIFVPKKFTADIKSSLETVDESFFESIWVEITDPLTENYLLTFPIAHTNVLVSIFLIS